MRISGDQEICPDSLSKCDQVIVIGIRREAGLDSRVRVALGNFRYENNVVFNLLLGEIPPELWPEQNVPEFLEQHGTDNELIPLGKRRPKEASTHASRCDCRGNQYARVKNDFQHLALMFALTHRMKLVISLRQCLIVARFGVTT